MKLVNDTQQAVFYSISCSSSADCGTIDVNGEVDLPYYDNQTDVTVNFSPVSGENFVFNCDETQTDEVVLMYVTSI